MQSTIANDSDGYTSTPPTNNGTGPSGAGLETQLRATSSIGFTQPKGLQLGGSKANARVVAAQLIEQVAAEEGVINAWGTSDLIDVNADEEDWSKLLHLLECSCSLVSLFRWVRECACCRNIEIFSARPRIWCFKV